jgi:hypothetical protein
MAVNLAAVGVNDFAVETQGKLNCQLRLANTGRTDNRYQFIHYFTGKSQISSIKFQTITNSRSVKCYYSISTSLRILRLKDEAISGYRYFA